MTESEIFTKNTPLIKNIVRRFNPANDHEFDDFFQIGSIAALNAIRKHDPKRGKLSTIMHIAITRAIMSYIRKNSKHFHTESYSNSEEPIFERGFDIRDLEEFLPDLTNIERQVFELKCKQFTFEEIGEKLGKSKGWSFVVHKRVLEKIREANKDIIVQ